MKRGLILAVIIIAGCASIQAQRLRAKWEAAGREAARIAAECRQRRLSGELPAHVASAQCSNERMRQVWAESGYPYMDLVDLGLAYRMALARRVDERELSEEEAQLRWAELNTRITNEIQRRNALARQQYLQEQQAYSQRLQATGALLYGLGVWEQSQYPPSPPAPTVRGPITCYYSLNRIDCY